MTENNAQQAKFINPPNTLKLKVGHGGISPALLKQSQKIIEKNDFDFAPFAQKYIEQIQYNLDKLNAHPSLKSDSQFIAKFVEPIMGLKANGGMFQYPLVSMIADVGLQFIDRAKEVNKDGQEIIQMHNKCIQMILSAKLKGYVGKEGQSITDELRNACERYFKKYSPN